jgi:hypothetical protein
VVQCVCAFLDTVEIDQIGGGLKLVIERRQRLGGTGRRGQWIGVRGKMVGHCGSLPVVLIEPIQIVLCRDPRQRKKHARGRTRRKVDYIVTIIVTVMIFVMMTIIMANGE